MGQLTAVMRTSASGWGFPWAARRIYGELLALIGNDAAAGDRDIYGGALGICSFAGCWRTLGMGWPCPGLGRTWAARRLRPSALVDLAGPNTGIALSHFRCPTPSRPWMPAGGDDGQPPYHSTGAGQVYRWPGSQAAIQPPKFGQGRAGSASRRCYAAYARLAPGGHLGAGWAGEIDPVSGKPSGDAAGGQPDNAPGIPQAAGRCLQHPPATSRPADRRGVPWTAPAVEHSGYSSPRLSSLSFGDSGFGGALNPASNGRYCRLWRNIGNGTINGAAMRHCGPSAASRQHGASSTERRSPPASAWRELPPLATPARCACSSA